MKTKDLSKSIFYTLTESLVTLLSSIVTAFVVARLIGPTEFGLASLAYLVGSLAESFIAVAFTEALIRRPYYDARVVDTAFTSMFASSVVVFAVLCALAPVLASLYHAPELALLIVVQATTCLLLGLRGVPEAALARKLRFRALALRGITAKLSSAILSIVLAFAGAGAWSLILGNVAFALAGTILIYAVTTRRPRFSFSRTHLFELLNFGRFSVADSLLGAATPRLYQAIVGYFGGPTAAGQISIAFRINDAVGALIGAVTVRMALPVFSRMAGQPQEEFQRNVTRAMGLIFAVAAPFFLGIALLSSGIVELVMGPAWAGAKAPLVAVSLFSVCNFATVVSGPVMKALGRPDRAAMVPASGFVFVMVGSIAVAHWGLIAQLYVWAGFGVLYFALSALNLRSIAGISFAAQLRRLSGTVISLACMTAAVWACQLFLQAQPLWLLLCSQVVSGGLCYLLASMVFQREALTLLMKVMPFGKA